MSEKSELLKTYSDKNGRKVELWKTPDGYTIIVKVDNTVLIQEHYTKFRGASKRYWWYTREWIKQEIA